MNHSDQQLIINYLAGDEKSLEILIKRYLKPVYSFVYQYVGNRQEAEDVTQEVFVRIWRNLKRFDQQKKFKTWIFIIAKNTSIDWLRKKKTVPFSNFENEKGENGFVENLADSAPLPDEILERTGLAAILNKAISQLALKYRMVLFLRYNDSLTFKEIGRALGESLNTVKSRHRRALIQLRKLLPEI